MKHSFRDIYSLHLHEQNALFLSNFKLEFYNIDKKF